MIDPCIDEPCSIPILRLLWFSTSELFFNLLKFFLVTGRIFQWQLSQLWWGTHRRSRFAMAFLLILQLSILLITHPVVHLTDLFMNALNFDFDTHQTPFVFFFLAEALSFRWKFPRIVKSCGLSHQLACFLNHFITPAAHLTGKTICLAFYGCFFIVLALQGLSILFCLVLWCFLNVF